VTDFFFDYHFNISGTTSKQCLEKLFRRTTNFTTRFFHSLFPIDKTIFQKIKICFKTWFTAYDKKKSLQLLPQATLTTFNRTTFIWRQIFCRS
jgi:hypothetical protein